MLTWKKIFDIGSIPQALLPWLANADSMTQALEDASGVMSHINVQDEAWQLPWQDEIDYLAMDAEQCWVREIVLSVGKPALFARTVFPKAVMNDFPALIQLGNKPLGKIIFSNNTFQRGTIEVAKISEGDLLWEQIPHMFQEKTHWARRSLFHSPMSRFLLTEVLLSYVETL